jgi:hypothetical protein
MDAEPEAHEEAGPAADAPAPESDQDRAEVPAIEAVPAPARPDWLAVVLAIGIAVLLLACAALMLVAWRRAPAGPVVPGPGLIVL